MGSNRQVDGFDVVLLLLRLVEKKQCKYIYDFASVEVPELGEPVISINQSSSRYDQLAPKSKKSSQVLNHASI